MHACAYPNMHILEEGKKSLAYDLKLSCIQIGICLEIRENQMIYLELIHNESSHTINMKK